MIPTEILSDEHRVIVRVLSALDRAATKFENEEEVRPAFFLDAADFIKGFADGCHHKKEEGVLFKAMTSSGLPSDTGPIAVMLAEHEQGRVYTRSMRAAAQRFIEGDKNARKDVVLNARGYVNLLRQHILKEDNILFPMADRVITPETQIKVVKDFDMIEHEETGEGIHEKYLALAESLENEIR
jgi:hemerythrin-like domain-containing protein